MRLLPTVLLVLATPSLVSGQTLPHFRRDYRAEEDTLMRVSAFADGTFQDALQEGSRPATGRAPLSFHYGSPRGISNHTIARVETPHLRDAYTASNGDLSIASQGADSQRKFIGPRGKTDTMRTSSIRFEENTKPSAKPWRSSTWPRLEADREESKLRALVTRLRQRKLVEWMLAYFALAWMVLQMADVLREIWDWPVGLQRGITLALAFGALPAWVIAWYHGEKGRQRVSVAEGALVGALMLGSGWLIWILCA